MMNKLHLFISLFCFLLIGVSCSHRQNAGQEEYEEDYFGLEAWNTDKYEGTRHYFLPNTDGFVYMIDDFDLEELYKWNYNAKYHTFEEFKKQALAGSVNLDYKTIQDDSCAYYCYVEQFKADAEIMGEYEKVDIDSFKGKYCETCLTLVTWNDGAFDNEEANDSPGNVYARKLTVAYCLWLSGYKYYSKGCFNEMYFRKSAKDTIFVTYQNSASEPVGGHTCCNLPERTAEREWSEVKAVVQEEFDSIAALFDCYQSDSTRISQNLIHARMNEVEIWISDKGDEPKDNSQMAKDLSRCVYLLKKASGCFDAPRADGPSRIALVRIM